MTTDRQALDRPMTPVLSQRRWLAILRHFVLIIVGVALLYPLIWMVSSSFKHEGDIFRGVSLIPSPGTLQNYVDGWNGVPGYTFTTFFINTLIICALSVAGNLASCSLAAYAFARLNFAGRRVFFGAMLVTVMIPSQVILIPQYIVYFKLGWIDTFLPLIVPKWLATDAFFVFLMTQFIRGLPRELDDAARIDGCSEFGVYRRIVLPLAAPALLTTGFFTFVWTFDDFFNQLIFLNSTRNFTVAVGLMTFLDASGKSQWGPMFAMSVISLIPVVIVFLTMQKRLVQGIATTGLTG